MYILNIASAIKKISVNEIRDFIFVNYYKQIAFCKENIYYSVRHLKQKKISEKVSCLPNDKEHYQSFVRKKTQNH